MSNILQFIKDILAPKRCYWCKKQWHFLCPSCESKITKYNPICYVCKKPSDDFKTHDTCKQDFSLDQVLLYTHYHHEVVSKLIKHGKFYHKRDIWEEISKYYVGLLEKHLDTTKKYVLVPVPMYFWKKSFRGYNQSELLVKHISKQTGIPAEYNLIKKTKSTSQQSHLSKSQRKQNLQWSFKVNKKALSKYKNHTIILIDDVISTGTTLNLIFQLLKESGAEKVIGCVFASD